MSDTPLLPEANELVTMAQDARRYAARRRTIFDTRLRLQVGGPRPSWEEFVKEYDAACDKEAAEQANRPQRHGDVS